ncbi:MAG: DUF1801 domain-containing protein [Pseudomonadota bacterium]
MSANVLFSGPPFANDAVAAAFAAFPDAARPGLMRLRAMIFDTAAGMPQVGPLTETLKWGQPSYAPAKRGIGSPLRLGAPKTGGAAIYAHCNTTIIGDFRAFEPGAFTFEGNRGVHLDPAVPPPAPLRLLIAAALTYHLD